MPLIVVFSLLLLFSTLGAGENKFFGQTVKEIKNFAKQIAKNISSFFSTSSPDSIEFFLYEQGSNFPIIITEKNASEHIDVSLRTYFILHGWTSNGTLPWVKECAKKLHQVGKFNVIAVDWRILAAVNYFSAVKNIKVVGDRIKDFIKSLNFSLNEIEIIGHSLGAQVASAVGLALGSKKINTIVGLDPAGPLFDWPIPLLPQYRLTSDDAKIVQVIHTMVFFAGVTIPCGTIDFYVNKGKNQPKCSNGTIEENVSCNHQRSHTYYIQTITNPKLYQGTKSCPLDFSGCKTDKAYMGYGIDGTKSGVYNVTADETDISSITFKYF